MPDDGQSLDPVALRFLRTVLERIPTSRRATLVTGQPYYIASIGVAHGYPVTIHRNRQSRSPITARSSSDATISSAAPNGGQGFAKNVGGNQLPNAPHFTVSLSGEYTMPVSENWAATLHSDFYWQSQSFARICNDKPYDKIRGYSNVNLALILNDASGWQMMGYVKNIFDTTAITGDFLYSDDTGLTTNVFLTDPRLYRRARHQAIRRRWTAAADSTCSRARDGKSPMIWLTVGGDFSYLAAKQDPYRAGKYRFRGHEWRQSDLLAGEGPVAHARESPAMAAHRLRLGLRGSHSSPPIRIGSLKMGVRYGRSSHSNTAHQSQPKLVPTNFSGIPCT